MIEAFSANSKNYSLSYISSLIDVKRELPQIILSDTELNRTQRDIKRKILNSLESKKCIIINKPRAIGVTTVLNNVSLDLISEGRDVFWHLSSGETLPVVGRKVISGCRGAITKPGTIVIIDQPSWVSDFDIQQMIMAGVESFIFVRKGDSSELKVTPCTKRDVVIAAEIQAESIRARLARSYKKS